MAKEVQKNTWEVKITDLGGHEFTATDTDQIKAGKMAFDLFMHKDTVEIKEEDKTTYIPYHAICHVEVTVTSEKSEVEDDTCKDIEWCCKDSVEDEPVEP